MNELVELITCKKCGQQKTASRHTTGWCEDCEKAYNNRVSHQRRHMDNWMEVAKDAGLELWERQPGETQLEWSIWQAYRDSYPGKKPNYKDVIQVVDTTLNYVKQTAARWQYAVRMQAWIAECDRITLAQRRQEILNMNKEHVDMAQRLRNKMSKAIDLIDPAYLKPSDLNSLLKTATELERKARLDEERVDEERRDMLKDIENPNLKKSPTKQDDLGEVLSILIGAGVLGSVTHVGVRETTTTTRELVAKDGTKDPIVVMEGDE